jgi:hypothetical protein
MKRLLSLGERNKTMVGQLRKTPQSVWHVTAPLANFLSTTPGPCLIHCVRRVTLQRLFYVHSLFNIVITHLDLDSLSRASHVS